MTADHMPIRSTIIVPALEFLNAVKAMASIATPKLAQFDVIQLRITKHHVLVTAANLQHVALVEVGLELSDIESKDDLVVTLPLCEAKEAVKVCAPAVKADSDFPQQLGLLIAEQWVELSDESGLGLGLKRIRLNRESPDLQFPNVPEYVGRFEKDAGGGAVAFTPDQLDALKSVSRCLGLKCLPAIGVEAGRASSRVFISTDSFRSISIVPSQAPEVSVTEETEPMLVPDQESKPTALRIVRANPKAAT